MDCCNNKGNHNQSNYFSFIKSKMFLLCLFGIAAALGAIYIFKIPASSLFTLGIFLLCPLLHIFMMKNHKH